MFSKDFTSNIINLLGGVALTLVPVVGDIAGGAVMGVGAGMIASPIKQTIEGRKMDFEILGDDIGKAVNNSILLQMENGYDSPSIMPSFDRDD